MPDLSITLAGIPLVNPLVIAAGTCGYVEELADVLDPREVGAVITKSITPEPREGNAPWRVVETERGMLNAIGLANVGVERFIAEKLPAAARLGTVVFGSIAGASIDDYVQVAARFDAADHLPAVELNVSCPNTADGRLFGDDPAALREVVAAARAVLTRTKLIVKLPPDAADVVALAGAAVEAGADALTVANTFRAMAIDVERRRPRLSRRTGGLSGPGTHPIVVRLVDAVYCGVARPAGVPVIGLGGVMSWQDAAEFILAGATAVGMGTALFVDPASPRHVLRGLERWVQHQGCRSITELIGALDEAEPPHAAAASEAATTRAGAARTSPS